MGWWGTGQDDDIIGDGPADTMLDTFKEIISHDEQQGKQKPTLVELLNAIVAALRRKPEAILAEGSNLSLQSVTAELEGQPDQVSSSDGPPPDDFLVRALFNAFEEIAVEYEDTELERKPRVSELLATIAFILRRRTQDYLSSAEDISLKGLTAQYD